ncbi:MAG: MerR family transcriptional regulator [Chloroflexia bacterium]|nr:MerR family transcriptional regulator [Chloroflexia bacterium]
MALFNRLPTLPVYNTRAVVQRTGVPADTFRAWERRYGLPLPARTKGNHRLYSERDIATIAWLRDQTEGGLTISQAVQLFRRRDDGEPASDAIEPAIQSPQTVEPDPRMGRFAAETVEALVAYDALAASRVVEEALALLSLEDVCLHVLQPALYEIGRRWERGEIEISAEHFASAFVIRRLGALFNLSQAEAGRGPVVAACLEGELHEIGLLLTCLFLSRRGIKIVYLGPNLPLDDLIETVQRLRPPLVLVSATTPDTAEFLAGATGELKARCSTALPEPYVPTVGFGGGIFLERPELRSGIDGVFLGRNADEASSAIDAVLQPTPTPLT